MSEIGRPPLYATPEEFRFVADAYFADCAADSEKPVVPTVNGLCLALGMTRETLLRYEEKPEFSDVVKMVRMRLEASWEQRLAGPNATGTIFWLKNQGWSDRTEQQISGPNGGPMQTSVKVEFVRAENPDA